MNNTAITCKPYDNIPSDWDTKSKNGQTIKDCCKSGGSDEPSGCDCCYDEWNNELKSKSGLFGQKTEEALQAKEALLFSKARRDGFKKWFDELVLVDEYSRDICDQFSLIISQVDKICDSSRRTIKAVETLYCMIRDFYSQLDKVQLTYERLQKCIKEFDSSVLAPDKGIMRCLDAYNQKLQALLASKSDLIRQIMDVVRLANLLQEDVCPAYGLSCIISRWRVELGCDVDPDDSGDEHKAEPSKSSDEANDECVLRPALKFPIRNDKYYKWLEKSYKELITTVETNSKTYLKVSQEKEAIAAAIGSLKEAVALTDPKERCK
jgi:hypothetical protein